MKSGELGFGPDLKRLGLIASTTTLRDASHRFKHSNQRHLPEVVDFCLDEAEFPQEAIDLLDAFLARLNYPYAFVAAFRATAAVLAEKLPFRFLDGAVLNPALEDHHRRKLFAESRRLNSPLDGVDEPTLIDWCRRGDFQERLTALSQAIHPFAPQVEGNDVVFSGQAHAILDAAQNPAAILGNFADSIRPNGWSGSLADIIAARCRPFEALLLDDRPDVRMAAQDLVPRIRTFEREQRQLELDRAHQRDQRFE